jgi:SAM-dependent methyltransferase
MRIDTLMGGCSRMIVPRFVNKARSGRSLVLIAMLGVAEALTAAEPRPALVPYEPTPRAVVEAMLRLAEVGPRDVVYDLGCGDGRIVIEAVRTRGARGVCVDIDARRTAIARDNARRAGVTDRIEFRTQDVLDTPLAGATVVTMFLSAELNLALRPKLERELGAGARVVSHWHSLGDWQPDRIEHVRASGNTRAVRLWILPRR